MIHRTRAILTILAILTTTALAAAAPQPWQAPYEGDEATGPNVLGLWTFDAADPARDASGNGNDLALRGRSRFVDGGRFGGKCLEIFRVDSKTEDKPEGAAVLKAPKLNPKGAFTIDLWMKPKPEFADDTTAFLVDKKYYHYNKDIPRANMGYCIYMRKRKGKWRLNAFLGFGTDSAGVTSQELDFEVGTWYHIAFTYDGNGTGAFFLNSKPVGGGEMPGRGAVAPSNYPFVIGCRVGSVHDSFTGTIDQVRLSNRVVPFFSGEMLLSPPAYRGRTAFEHMEGDIPATAEVHNDTGADVAGATLEITTDGKTRTVKLPKIENGTRKPIEIPIDTALKPGTYKTRIVLRTGKGSAPIERTFDYVIAPRRVPGTMPVVMWGGGDTENLKRIGFTHDLMYSDYFHTACWNADGPVDSLRPDAFERWSARLNERLANGLSSVLNLAPGRRMARVKSIYEEVHRIDRKGKPYERENVCGLFDKVRHVCGYVGESAALVYGHFPAARACLIHSEVRDGTNLCFHDHDREAFRKFAGYGIPDLAVAKSGLAWNKIPGFPVGRIMPDDHPLLVYYRWFWKDGDGWNAMHSAVSDGLKKHIKNPEFWTFNDPAVRAPSIWGSGGDVDIVSNWTYSYPDPIKIGQTTDELFAMADGRPGQQVMKMTQIIWYRSRTAPKVPKDESKRAQWEKDIPDAKFITIAPDHLREAFWSKLSRPIRGIMYHGWSSLVKVPGNKHSYRYTNPRTREVLAELTHKVVQPLGPTLLKVPDAAPRVAMLQSFCSQMFAHRGTRGWGMGWDADAHLVLQWAHLQPRIVYEETVQRDGLDAFEVLVLVSCDVLPESVAKEIAKFQARGGIVVSDQFSPPSIVPDIVLESYKRVNKPHEDKRVLQERAAKLRNDLAPIYRSYAGASSQDIVVRTRRYKNADYLFALNDKRTYGDYVGHHGKVMEKGLPLEGQVSLNRPDGHVYDLLAHQPVRATSSAEGLAIDARFAPGDGHVWLVCDQAIANVQIEAPTDAKRNGKATCTIRVVDASGKPIAAAIPLRVDITDPAGNPAEFTGYYTATDDEPAKITLDISPNDATGTWTIRAQELASGKTSEAKMVVEE